MVSGRCFLSFVWVVSIFKISDCGAYSMESMQPAPVPSISSLKNDESFYARHSTLSESNGDSTKDEKLSVENKMLDNEGHATPDDTLHDLHGSSTGKQAVSVDHLHEFAMVKDAHSNTQPGSKTSKDAITKSDVVLPSNQRAESGFTDKTKASELHNKPDGADMNNETFANIDGKCSCGKLVKKRIVGGIPLEVKNFPWIVQLLNGCDQFCGGTIINRYYIVTAAHCVENKTPSDIIIRVGHTSFEDPGVKLSVEKIIPHEKYSDITEFDIALIKLTERLTFNYKVQPICLTSLRNNFGGTTGVIAGWGSTELGGPSSNHLRGGKVNILTNIRCKSVSLYPKLYINNRVVCARRLGVDSCQGDSGGPLAAENDGKYYLVGATSYGFRCALPRFPGIYTSVPTYYSWIKERTQDGEYCPE